MPSKLPSSLALKCTDTNCELSTPSWSLLASKAKSCGKAAKKQSTLNFQVKLGAFALTCCHQSCAPHAETHLLPNEQHPWHSTCPVQQMPYNFSSFHAYEVCSSEFSGGNNRNTLTMCNPYISCCWDEFEEQKAYKSKPSRHAMFFSLRIS